MTETIETIIPAPTIDKLTKLAWAAIKPHLDASPDPAALVVATFANALAIVMAGLMKDDPTASYSQMISGIFHQHGLYALVARGD